ncbi:hypothetical protein BDQ17DRAFT_1430120 [Cyathus striatus]|nr:hypothetical protein BDQ17DRAFT_1430120 [Cyathus striatus]
MKTIVRCLAVALFGLTVVTATPVPLQKFNPSRDVGATRREPALLATEDNASSAASALLKRAVVVSESSADSSALVKRALVVSEDTDSSSLLKRALVVSEGSADSSALVRRALVVRQDDDEDEE